MRSIHIDSCAFDPKYDPESKAAEELHHLDEAGEIHLQIAHSTQKEIEHPNTPARVKDQAGVLVFTEETDLTQPEFDLAHRILTILAGNGRPENVRQDATHVFEANKYGWCFVTTDDRILKKRAEIARVCHVRILKPSECMGMIEKYRR